ncbi:MAG: hypothetical protein ABGY41_01515 [Candidatus Poribacteria bacterium]
MMSLNRPRTPVARAVIGTLAILAKPALAGWILRALGMLLLGLLPFAAVSTYGGIPPDTRVAFVAAVLGAAAAGGGLYAIGTWLRR